MKKLIILIVCSILFQQVIYEYQMDQLLQEAYSKIDFPYVYGSHGDSSFDCSGFTYYLYKKYFGITLKRSAKDQGYDETYTKVISIMDLLPGDCVYFNTESGDGDLSDHAGIYYGDGIVIHASSSKCKVVTVNLYENEYYQKVFSWGRRIINLPQKLNILIPENNIIIDK